MTTAFPTLEQIAALPLTHTATVEDDWIDVMGHMNVAYYTSAFSSAMQKLRSSLGIDNQLVQEKEIGTFALETHTRYIAELRVGEPVRVYSRVLDRAASQKRLHAMHFLINSEQNRLSATFEAVVANVDLRQRKMVPILPEVLSRLDEMIARHQSLGWAPPVCGVLSC